MKGRFWVFAFETYYQGGGLDYLVGAFDTMAEAVACAAAQGDRYTQILDSVEREDMRTEVVGRDGHIGRVARDRLITLAPGHPVDGRHDPLKSSRLVITSGAFRRAFGTADFECVDAA